MFCTHCGSKIPNAASFCASCGAPVSSSQATLQVGEVVSMSDPANMPRSVAPKPPPPQRIEPYAGEYSHRSKVVAGLLQIFFGGLGIGRFYTGHVGMAIAQLLVTICTCGLGAIWPLIDGIILLATDSRDAEGRRLRG